ncbi:hypothetical protein LIT25_27635 (plasmid) [Bacillus sp. F19]|nr:hypothetical protein LIT25_27635 [Bacillus sp. F19]
MNKLYSSLLISFLTNHFGVNLFVPSEFISSVDEIDLANIKLEPIYVTK